MNPTAGKETLVVELLPDRKAELRRLAREYEVGGMGAMVDLMVEYFTTNRPEVTRTFAPKAVAQDVLTN